MTTVEPDSEIMAVFTSGKVIQPEQDDDDEADTFIGALGRSWSKEWSYSRTEKRMRRSTDLHGCIV